MRSILRQNDYPEVISNLTISQKTVRFYQNVKESPQKCPVYLKLPWIGIILLQFEIKSNLMWQLFFSFPTSRYFPTAHDSALNSQKCCTHHTTKLCRINTCAALNVGTWVAHP